MRSIPKIPFHQGIGALTLTGPDERLGLQALLLLGLGDYPHVRRSYVTQAPSILWKIELGPWPLVLERHGIISMLYLLGDDECAEPLLLARVGVLDLGGPLQQGVRNTPWCLPLFAISREKALEHADT